MAWPPLWLYLGCPPGSRSGRGTQIAVLVLRIIQGFKRGLGDLAVVGHDLHGEHVTHLLARPIEISRLLQAPHLRHGTRESL